jgi:hypothetical protein
MKVRALGNSNSLRVAFDPSRPSSDRNPDAALSAQSSPQFLALPTCRYPYGVVVRIVVRSLENVMDLLSTLSGVVPAQDQREQQDRRNAIEQFSARMQAHRASWHLAESSADQACGGNA